MERAELIVACLLASLAVSIAQASPVSDHYVPVPHRNTSASAATTPEVRLSTGNPLDEIGEMVQQGYEFLGYSTFNGPQVGKGALLDQARRVSADVVVAGSRYTGTTSNGSIGGTTFTRFGSFSFALPLATDRYDQFALFFAKAPQQGLGVELQLIKPSEAALLGTNMGVRAMAVVRGSPAFMADVLPGDVITAINSRPVYDGPTFKAALEAAYGTNAKLMIIRSGETLQKNIPLSADGSWVPGVSAALPSASDGPSQSLALVGTSIQPPPPPAPGIDDQSVRMERQAGVFVVPVLINGAIQLKFAVDSGAADVNIPGDVFLTLVRTGTIEPSDYLGTRTYTLADGSSVPSRTFRIRTLQVGSVTLENVVASVGDPRGDLLLGQSFLSRFSSWSINNDGPSLILRSASAGLKAASPSQRPPTQPRCGAVPTPGGIKIVPCGG